MNFRRPVSRKLMIMAIFCVGWALLDVWVGEFQTRSGVGGSRLIRRDSEPRAFWTSITVKVQLSFFLAISGIFTVPNLESRLRANSWGAAGVAIATILVMVAVGFLVGSIAARS